MKDSFIVQYAVQLWIASLGLTGPFGAFVSLVATRILGDMLDRGLIELDIQIDKLKEALKEEKWREAALKAYNKARKQVYSDEEKEKIRKEYLKAIRDYATISGV